MNNKELTIETDIELLDIKIRQPATLTHEDIIGPEIWNNKAEEAASIMIQILSANYGNHNITSNQNKLISNIKDGSLTPFINHSFDSCAALIKIGESDVEIGRAACLPKVTGGKSGPIMAAFEFWKHEQIFPSSQILRAEVRTAKPTKEVPVDNQEHMDFQEKLDIKLKPLDPIKIDDVLDRYIQKHIIHKQGAIIFVGSGGGKSTFCRNQIPNSDRKTDFIDEDLVYRETDAHPCEIGSSPLKPLPWWTWGGEKIDQIELRCDQVNKALVDKGLWALTTSFTQEAECQPDCIVLLPWEEHKKRIIEKYESGHYDGGAKPDEAGFQQVFNHRKWTEEVALENNIPIFDSIEKAVEFIKSRKG